MSDEQDIPEFNGSKPYSLNSGEGKINTYDQGGHLYDGLTKMPLEGMDRDKYAIPEGAPFSKVKSTQEKLEDAINTIRASGAVDADALANFDRMFRNLLLEGGASKPSQDIATPQTHPTRRRGFGETQT